MIGLGHPLVSLGELCWILHFKLGFYKSDQSIFSFSNQILCSPCWGIRDARWIVGRKRWLETPLWHFNLTSQYISWASLIPTRNNFILRSPYWGIRDARWIVGRKRWLETPLWQFNLTSQNISWASLIPTRNNFILRSPYWGIGEWGEIKVVWVSTFCN